MIVKVRMCAFNEVADGIPIRAVEVPRHELLRCKPNDWDTKLNLVFQYGQNTETQKVDPPCYSVSVGDVIELEDRLFLVLGLGYKQIDEEIYQLLLQQPRSSRLMQLFLTGDQ